MTARLVEAGFELLFTNHAQAIISHDFAAQIAQVESALLGLSLPVSEIIGGGGGEAKMTQRLRKQLASSGWPKHNFELVKIVDGQPRESISHEIDHVHRSDKGVIALEIEWNNKDPFFDRDLENFKRLHAEGAISMGIIITRGSEMQAQMRDKVRQFAQGNGLSCYADLESCGIGTPTGPQKKQIERSIAGGADFADAWARKFVADKYGMATTHWNKLIDRVHRGVGNPCPLMLVGLPVSIIDMTR